MRRLSFFYPFPWMAGCLSPPADGLMLRLSRNLQEVFILLTDLFI